MRHCISREGSLSVVEWLGMERLALLQGGMNATRANHAGSPLSKKNR